MKTLFLFLLSAMLAHAAKPGYNGEAFLNQLRAEADFEVLMAGVRLERFDLGLGAPVKIESSRGEVAGWRTHHVNREECVEFFKKQKPKSFVLVHYRVMGLEGDELAAEVKRTVTYFQGAGYKRVVLIQSYNQGIGVFRDTAGTFRDGHYEWFESYEKKAD